MDMLKEVLYNNPKESLNEYVKDEFGNIVPKRKIKQTEEKEPEKNVAND